MNDNELDQLLKSAAREEVAPIDFRSGVWSRIQVGDSRGAVPAFLRLEQILALFARPAVATSACVAMIVAGAAIGNRSESHGADGKSTYVQVVSPFASRIR